MCLRKIHRNSKRRTAAGLNLLTIGSIDGERFSSSHISAISGPSRRTQEGSKDNATSRLDSSLETPTVNSPRCSFR